MIVSLTTSFSQMRADNRNFMILKCLVAYCGLDVPGSGWKGHPVFTCCTVAGTCNLDTCAFGVAKIFSAASGEHEAGWHPGRNYSCSRFLGK